MEHTDVSLLAFAGILTALSMTGIPCEARDYHLSPKGSDRAPGTKTRPWKSIDKANVTAKPGDTVIFLPGTYNGIVKPERAGSKGAPITYRSQKYRAAILVGLPNRSVMELSNRSYLHVEGFHISPTEKGGWLSASYCDHLVIRGCFMQGAYRTLTVRRCNEVRLIDNVFTKGRVTGNMVCVIECSYVLIEGNSFTRVGHSPLQITTCRNVVIRSNCFRNDWGRNYEFWASGRLLIENNIITQARDSAYSADSRAKNLYYDSIFRFNHVFRNLHTPLNSSSYFPSGAKPTSYFREPFRLVNSRFYHNTITNNLGHGWELGGINISSNVFVNNIFFRNDKHGGGVQFCVSDTISRDNRFRFNLFGGTQPGQHVIKYGRGKYWTADEGNNKSRMYGGFWKEFEGNIDTDPCFTHEINNDFRLKAGSPCIDAGRPLTCAMGSGESRKLPVSDARYFYDGFGIEGEQGDWIAVGKGDNVARIVKVELNYCQPGILHLDRNVKWSDGMPVSLPWSGARPDIGAYEHEGRHPTRVIALVNPYNPTPGESVSFRVDSMGKTVKKAEWDFGDGTRSDKLSTSHRFEKAGNHGVTVRVNYKDGGRGIDIVFVQVAERRDPKAPLVKCDFEDATRQTEWGFHFKFYRRWLTGYKRVSKESGGGKCMHLFYQKRKQCRAAGALAPGEWDIDAYPFIRFSYRIPNGVPVALCVEPFPGEKMPRGVILGGTSVRIVKPYIDIEAYTLEDDDKWHEITVDVRKARNAIKGLQHLYRFMFYTRWSKNEHQFWFDDFAVLPAQ